MQGKRRQLGGSGCRAIVFDMDDTLYPEADFVLSGFRAVAIWAEQELRIPAEQGFAELSQLFACGVRGDTFDHWLRAHAITVEAPLVQLIDIYRTHMPSLRPFPEVRPLLSALRRQYALGLLSDGYLGIQQRKLAALGLAQQFDAVVFSDELGREAWKPSTKPFELVLRRLGVEPPKSIYIADNPLKDFLGARQLGMQTVWVRRHGGEYTQLEPPSPAHAPTLTVRSLAAVAELFELSV